MLNWVGSNAYGWLITTIQLRVCMSKKVMLQFMDLEIGEHKGD